MLHPYLWIVIVSGFVCFLVACGNGANDLANAFGTSYGSRVLTLAQIVIIATCCEFLGAAALGSNVAATMSGGIASTSTFENDPYVLMYGFLCALASTFVWLLLATWQDLPVSSHHAIAGGIIGFALVFGGGSAVHWAGSKTTFPYVSGVVPIVISWFISPMLSGIVAAIFYCAVRFLILQRDNAVRIAPYTLPVVVLVTFFLEFFFIFMIAASSKLGWPTSHAAWMAAVVAAAAALLSIAFVPLLKRRIRSMEEEAQLRAEERGVGLEKAMRETLAGGRTFPNENADDDHDSSDGRNGMTSYDGAIVSLPISPSDSPVLGPQPGPAASGRHSNKNSKFGDRLPEKKLEDYPREADGAVVHDDDHEDDFDRFSDSVVDESPFGHANTHRSRHHHHHHRHLRREHTSQAPFQPFTENGGSSRGIGAVTDKPDSSDEHIFGNNNEAVGTCQACGADTPAVFSHSSQKMDKKKGEEENYVYVDGVSTASNGVHYDRQGVPVFDPRAEYLFRYLQVFTAACTSLAHGSNDVSNAIGPFSAIYDIYIHEAVRTNAPVPIWLLCLGGAGIVVGLATFGLGIMRVLGEQIALITPFRGFSAELATSLVVAFATTYGIPVSSTHCITGAVIAISMLDVGVRNVKWALVGKMYAGWMFTLVIAAIMSACFFSQGISTPIRALGSPAA